MEAHLESAKGNAFAASVITEKTFEEAPEEVECPFELQHIWEFFIELDETRPSNGMAVSSITHEEITAWAEGNNISLMPFERRCIRAIDKAYVTYQNSKAKERNERE